MEINEAPKFKIGDLVKYTIANIGAIIPPTYILGHTFLGYSKYDLGIIIADAGGRFKGRSFKVYWFKTAVITETFASHLILVD
tara:strand:- start:1682 stop:1930 length:249 start_codon:yes stop_codon:yes gene_type:complete